MDTSPLVTVVITTHNRVNLLGRAIDSVLAQSYKHIEVIVVDDFSSQSYESVKKKYHSIVRFIRNDKNIGLGASRNRGIKESSGELISFLDDDDEILPEKIEKQIELLRGNPQCDIVYCSSFRQYGEKKYKKKAKLKGNIYPKVLFGCPAPVHSLLIPIKILHEVGLFDESLSCFEDFDLWIRLSRVFTFNFVDMPLVIYHIHGKQMVSDIEKTIFGREIIIKKHLKKFNENKKFLAIQYRRQASASAFIGNYSEFYKYLFLSINNNPFYISNYGHFVFSHISKRLHKKIISLFGFAYKNLQIMPSLIENNCIDFIVIWVDGDDPKWQEEFNRYAFNLDGDKKKSRFRDWDNLRYLFRAFEVFTPWVHKIHFVTWGHLPPWLRTNHSPIEHCSS
jgi:glycosyltransferase involved in cell wall biosynthesis